MTSILVSARGNRLGRRKNPIVAVNHIITTETTSAAPTHPPIVVMVISPLAAAATSLLEVSTLLVDSTLPRFVVHHPLGRLMPPSSRTTRHPITIMSTSMFNTRHSTLNIKRPTPFLMHTCTRTPILTSTLVMPSPSYPILMFTVRRRITTKPVKQSSLRQVNRTLLRLDPLHPRNSSGIQLLSRLLKRRHRPLLSQLTRISPISGTRNQAESMTLRTNTSLANFLDPNRKRSSTRRPRRKSQSNSYVRADTRMS